MGVRFEPVAIGRLERFVADWHNANVPENPEVPESNGHRVAVVGSGPAGISCAGDLAKLGYSVTIFEALPVPGGVMNSGFPKQLCAVRLKSSVSTAWKLRQALRSGAILQ